MTEIDRGKSLLLELGATRMVKQIHAYSVPDESSCLITKLLHYFRCLLRKKLVTLIEQMKCSTIVTDTMLHNPVVP